MKNVSKALFLILLFNYSNLLLAEQYQEYDAEYDNTCGCGAWTFEADWLYWKAEQDHLNVGNSFQPSPNNNNPTDVDVGFLHPHFKYTNGYRLAASYDFPCDGWELGITYSYLPSSAGLSFNGSEDPSNTNYVFFISPDYLILNTVNNTNFFLLQSDWHFQNLFS